MISVINLSQMPTEAILGSIFVMGVFVTIWIWMVLKAQKEKIELMRYI